MILHLYFARRFGMSFLLITAVLFTLVMRRSGLYPLIERLSKDKPASPP